MSQLTLKDAKRIIDAHFEGRGGPHSAEAARKAIAEVPAAQAHYEKRALLAELDPKGMGAQDRIAASLGIPTSSPTPSKTPWFAGVGAFAMAAGLFAVLMTQPTDDGFVARGSGDAGEVQATVIAYNLSKNKKALAASDVMGKDDELAFAYVNPQGQKHLMVFAVDEKKNVYWFHPAWTDPDARPSAIAVEQTTQQHELKEAVAHDYQGGKLQVFAYFSDEPHDVVEVESWVGKGDLLKRPGVTQLSAVQVTP